MKNDFVSQDDLVRLTMWIRCYIKYTVVHEYGHDLPSIFVPHIKLGFSHFLFLRYASDAGGRYFKELCDMIKGYFLSNHNPQFFYVKKQVLFLIRHMTNVLL